MNSIKMILPLLAGCLLTVACRPYKDSVSATEKEFVLAIHGGAGTILKKNMTDSMEQAYKAVLEEALTAGYEKLKQGKSSLDAVEQAIHVMEDSP